MSCSGDWMCARCQYQNFKKRDSCQCCGYPKYGGPDVPRDPYPRPPLPGDWYCTAMNCGAHNYASRSSCYKCRALKSGYGATVPLKPGDWICSGYGCGEHNYASRTECYKCRTPRDYGGAV